MSKDQETKSLRDTVTRGRARWLKRIMYDPTITSTEKCFAYIVFDHLNCVTLDSWQGPKRSAELLGKSIKTCERAPQSLERHGVLRIRRDRNNLHRFAPVFLPGDLDTGVREERQRWVPNVDAAVHESILFINGKPSTPTAGDGARGFKNEYERRCRGQIELQLIKMLGHGGADMLERLSAFDDSIVDLLCRAYALGFLGEAELAAARLAAVHMK